MTLNGAIMQLVEMRENSMMPVFFKPYLDKVIETISECEEPSAQPEIIRCKDCVYYDKDYSEELSDWCHVWSETTRYDGYCHEAEPYKGEQ